MPDAAVNLIRQPESGRTVPKKRNRPPRDVNRVETHSRLVIGRVGDPRTLDTRSRGRLRMAFQDVKRADGKTGPPSELEHIPEGNMRGYLLTVSHGVTPAIAATIWFGIEPSTAARWLRLGAEPDNRDPIKREFYLRTERAKAVARGDCEERVMLCDPSAPLLRGPLGRATADVPGWESQQLIKHANHDGTGPAAFVLEIATGYQTKKAPRELPAASDEEEA